MARTVHDFADGSVWDAKPWVLPVAEYTRLKLERAREMAEAEGIDIDEPGVGESQPSAWSLNLWRNK